MTAPRFRSRIDPVIGIILVVPSLVIGLPMLQQLRDGTGVPWLMVGIFAVVNGFVAWTVFGTWYAITDDTLIIRSGPLRSRIPLVSITRVRRSHTLISAPALSLRRLELDHGKFDMAVISPAREEEFLSLLKERAPGVDLSALLRG